MNHLRFASIIAPVVMAGMSVNSTAAPGADAAPVPDRTGLRCVSKSAFPSASDARLLLACDFEIVDGSLPVGWSQGNGEMRRGGGSDEDNVPQGRVYFRMKAKKNAGLRSPVVEVRPGTPCFLSYWIKASTDPWTTISFTSDEREPSFTNIHTPIFYDDFPLDTHGEWRQEGFYFVVPEQCRTVQFNIGPREDGADGQFVSLDDVRLRTASESEIAAAYAAERAHFPAENVTPRPGDGRYLAESVARWEGRVRIPNKPFVIWALGSSFTDRQGDGQELIRAIRERFPKAPPIIYRKHGGPGTPWEFIHGWMKQFVAVEEPDLIFTYTSGTMEGLEALLSEIRRHTTADVILPSLHFKPDSTMSPEDIEHGAGVDWSKVREICERHQVEFVENRREMADYIARTGIVPDDLLADHNHQNMHGRIRIWDHVIRHLVDAAPAAEPPSRVRRISTRSTDPTNAPGGKDRATAFGSWWSTEGVPRSARRGSGFKVRFTGTRLDLLGSLSPETGAVTVTVDGVPGDQAPVFFTDYIQPNKRSLWRIPHAVELGPRPVPQSWTITMTSDTGDYRLEGSATGADGTGNLARMFTSMSGQIAIDPKFWRAGRVEKPGQPVEYGVGTGDSFRFDVFRGAPGEVSFPRLGPCVVPLARNLPNAEHTVEFASKSDGMMSVEAFYIYEPPEK